MTVDTAVETEAVAGSHDGWTVAVMVTVAVSVTVAVGPLGGPLGGLLVVVGSLAGVNPLGVIIPLPISALAMGNAAIARSQAPRLGRMAVVQRGVLWQRDVYCLQQVYLNSS